MLLGEDKLSSRVATSLEKMLKEKGFSEIGPKGGTTFTWGSTLWICHALMVYLQDVLTGLMYNVKGTHKTMNVCMCM